MPPPDDVLLNKAAIVERSIRRIREEFEADPTLEHPTHRDALTLNIERACQAVIDSAMHVIAAHHLGVPHTSGHAFLLLVQAGMISDDTSRSMQAMTGFRNIAIHEYQQLDMTVLRSIAETRWRDLVQFFREIKINIQP